MKYAGGSFSLRSGGNRKPCLAANGAAEMLGKWRHAGNFLPGNALPDMDRREARNPPVPPSHPAGGLSGHRNTFGVSAGEERTGSVFPGTVATQNLPAQVTPREAGRAGPGSVEGGAERKRGPFPQLATISPFAFLSVDPG